MVTQKLYPGRKPEPAKDLPAVDESTRLYGHSGYTGADAKELARQASLVREVEVTEDLFFAVCDRLVQGEPLVLICSDRTMPSRPQLMRYLYKNEKAREAYYAAKEMQAETVSEEANIVAADDSNDFSFDTHGRRISHNDVVQRARLKIDQLRWTASKMAPKRYGDKNFTEIAGNANSPVVLQINTGVQRSEGSYIAGKLSAPKVIEGTIASDPRREEGSAAEGES